MPDESANESHDQANDQAAAGQEHAQQAAQDFKSAASAKVDELRQTYGAKVDDLKAAATSKANDLRDAASAKVDDLKAAANAKAGEYRDAATAKADELRGQAEAAWGDAKVKARTYQEDGEAYVRENPTRALLIAVGAGFMLGSSSRNSRVSRRNPMPATDPRYTPENGVPNLAESIRLLLASAVSYLHARLELFGLEAKDAAGNYVKIVFLLVSALLGMVSGFVFMLAAFVYLLAWLFWWHWGWVFLRTGIFHAGVCGRSRR